MANGYSLGVLQHTKEVTKGATPQYKVEPYGALASLLTAHSQGVIKNDSYNGHYKTAVVKAKQRITPDQTRTSRSCSNVVTQPYLERTVSVANVRQIAIHVEDEVIAAFDDYASAKQDAGMVSLMNEHMDSVMTAASALLQAVNTDLVTLMAANIGVNRATGAATAQTINIPQNTATLVLSNGIPKILADYSQNQMSGRPIVVGAGLFYNWMLSQAAKGIDQSGVMSRIQAAGFDFYQDYTVGTVTSQANDIFVYEKDAIHLVEYMRYQGFKAGPKPGASSFGIMTLPGDLGGGQLVPVKFDFQLRYNDCPEEMEYVDGEEAVTLQPGYNLILTKQFGLDTIPSTAYRSGDVLAGNRGSLRFRITNT